MVLKSGKIMEKYILTTAFILGAFLLNPSNLKAEEEPTQQSAIGFFVGGHVGYHYLRTKMDATSNAGGIAGGLVSTQRNQKSFQRSHGVIAGLSTGYIWTLTKHFFTGVDIEINIDNTSISTKALQNGQNFDYKFRRLFNITPALIIGAHIHDLFRLFFKLGLTLSEFKYTLRNNTDDLEFNEKKFDVGLAPSIGFDWIMTKKCLFTTTATYEMYRKNKAIFMGTIAPSLNVDNNVLAIRPNNFSLKFGVKYFF